MIWTDTQVTQLHALWQQCDAAGKPVFSRGEIAERMGLSRNAVIGKLGREFAGGRLKQRVVQETTAQQTRCRGAKQTKAAKIESAKISVARLLPQAPKKPLPSGLAEARPHYCQWPMWKHGDRSPAPPLFCGSVVLRGHAYCPEHCRVAFHNWHELSRVAAMAMRHVQDSIGRPF
jgi:hypothetical protein